MSPRSRRREMPLRCETLEGRALMTTGLKPPTGIAAMMSHAAAFKTDPAAVAAIMSALRGGPGSEFVNLLRSQVPNINSVVMKFVLGQINQFSTPGAAVKTPQFQSLYAGRHWDHMSLTAAGAISLRSGKIELGAIMRGPFDEAVPAQVVFGINRGLGARLGPAFAARPGITPDAIVTINVGPYGKGNSATVKDLTTGAVTAIDPSQIQVTGAVARVFVSNALLPSKGFALQKYTFATWTRDSAAGGIEHVGSFLPDAMIPIGKQK